MTAGGGKLYTAGSDMTIIAWNIENLTENIRVEVRSMFYKLVLAP